MNRLSKEQSPYLRQHAKNSVDWYPWCDEALERAKREDKPILLSIGYSACHWCHVMEKESFEDEDTAKLMNDKFINIKVDREERPDLDEVYMNAVHMMTGSGGWPLTVFLTPELVPFYGGTYFPPEDRQGMPGFKKLLLAVSVNFIKNRSGLNEICENVMTELKRVSVPDSSDIILNEQILDNYCAYLKSSFDGINGGFGGAPKFPRYLELLLLMKMQEKMNDNGILQMVLLSLRRMAEGGIRDHIGGGFHRYSVDAQWFAPHFEKMLYDNALLAPLYFQAYRLSDDLFYLEAGEEILKFIEQEMISNEGIFYSSLDADSEGEEGKYYTWGKNEIHSLLGDEDCIIFCKIFGIENRGNFENGSNIIFFKSDVQRASEEFGLDEEALKEKISQWEKILYTERNTRIRPSTDDKCISAWNGMMINAFAEVFLLTGRSEYLEIPKSAGEFFYSKFEKDGKLFRFYRKVGGFQDAFLDDYAAIIESFIALYRATLDVKWIERASALKEKTISLFRDCEDGGFFNSVQRDDLIIRSKSAFDNPVPSGNSMMFKCLVELWRLTGNEEDRRDAQNLLRSFTSSLKNAPYGHPAFLSGIFDYFYKSDEIFIAVKNIEEYGKIVRDISGLAGFSAVMSGIIDDNKISTKELLPSYEGEKCPEDKKYAIYYCRGNSCRNPVYSVDELQKLVQAG